MTCIVPLAVRVVTPMPFISKLVRRQNFAADAVVAVLAVLGARLFSRGVVHYGTMKAFKWKRA